MTVTFHAFTNRLQWLKNGIAKLDTALRTFMLVGTSALTLTGVSIAFPNFTLDNAYYWFGSIGGSTVTEQASSYVTIPPQEWGPSAPNVLSDTLLGTVPAGTDYLDIQAVITRTLAPNVLNPSAFTPIPKLGQRIYLRGGFCLVEEFFPVSRAFSIVLVGTNVYLRRYMSAAAYTQLDGVFQGWSASNSNSDNGRSTWGSAKGNYVAPIAWYSATVAGGAFSHQRGQVNQVTVSHSWNYATTYSADFIIKPGRFVTTPTVSAPASLAAIRTWYERQIASSTTFTFSSTPFFIADPTRQILVMIAGRSGTGARTISSVTIGGVSATKLVEAGGATGVASIWMANVPTGTSGNVVVTGSAALEHCAILSYALYHLLSTSARDTKTISTVTTGTTSVTLGTVANGFAFAVDEWASQSVSVNTPVMSGMPSQGHHAMEGTSALGSAGVIFAEWDMGFGKTTGAGIGITATVTSVTGNAMAAVSLA